MPDMYDCPVCGGARDTRTLNGNCPNCYSTLVPAIMKNLPDKLKDFFIGPNPNPHPRAKELGMTWFNRPDLTYKQAEEIAANRVRYAKKINAETDSGRKEMLRRGRDAREDEIAERIYNELMVVWEKTAQNAKQEQEAKDFLSSALRKD